MEYYIDENKKLHEKSGVDFLVKKGIKTLDGMTLATDEQIYSALNPTPTESELAQLAQSEMITELNWCDLQIKLHASSDKRAVSTLDDIYAYARVCRDYVQNVDGELTITGDKPVRPE